MKISKYFVLIGYFLSSIFLGGVATKAAESKAIKNVRAEEFDKLRAEKANVVLDVRRTVEFTSGHSPARCRSNGTDPTSNKKSLPWIKAKPIWCTVLSADAAAAPAKK